MSGIVWIFILSKFSVGISIDPLLWGLDFRWGGNEGFKFKIISGFYYSKIIVDSSQYTYSGREIYRFYSSRPNYWYGVESRGEYFFRSKIGIQPYLGVGMGCYKKREWDSEFKGQDSTYWVYPVENNSWYAGVVSAIGCEIYPLLLLSNLLKIDRKKSEVISFNFEFDLYYKFIHEFPEKIWWEEPEISGISLGAGIRINF